MIDLTTIILSLLTLIAGGGWFVNYKSNRNLKRIEVEKGKIQAKELSLAFYIKNIADLEMRLEKAMERQKEFEKQIIRLEKRLNQYEKKYGILDC